MKNPSDPTSPHTGALVPAQEPDEVLAAAIRESSGKDPAHQPVTELLQRHWTPVLEYARLCTDGEEAAGIAAAAAFTRQFGDTLRRTGPIAAWRPRLLTAARQVAVEWAATPRRHQAAPGLRALLERPGGSVFPARTLRLAHRAFRSLPEPAQCMLWHTAVEAEPLTGPAGLLGLDALEAEAQLEQAHEAFRLGCLRAHLELAPQQECRHYNRMLEVSGRRGGTGRPDDLERHLGQCAHCRQAADLLIRPEERLSRTLAEAVLGWAAEEYLASRPARQRQTPASRQLPPDDGGPGRGRRRAPASPGRGKPRAVIGRLTTRPGPGGNTALVVLGLLAGGLLAAGVVQLHELSGGSGTLADRPPAAPAGPGATPSASARSASRASAVAGMARTRLRNAGSELCLDIRDGQLKAGTDVVTVPCTETLSQQWTYTQDGQVQNAATPDLCLDSRGDASLGVGIGDCDQPAEADVRFDMTVQGTLLPRWNEKLAVTPVSGNSGAAVALKPRDGSQAQQWEADVVDASATQQRAQTSAITAVPVAATLPAHTPAAPHTREPGKSVPTTPKATPRPGQGISPGHFHPAGYGGWGNWGWGNSGWGNSGWGNWGWGYYGGSGFAKR